MSVHRVTEYRTGRYREERRYREYADLTVQEKLSQIAEFTAIVYDRNGVKIGQLSSINERAYMILDFALGEIGSGNFKLTLLREPPFLIDYSFKIVVYLFQSIVPWYAGYVTELPRLGSTDRRKVYSGVGYYNQLQGCVILNRVYAAEKVEDIVKHLVQNEVTPQSDIIYNAGKIQTTAYTVQDQQFFLVDAKKVMGELARLAGNWVFGVDEYQEFFFKPRDTGLQTAAIKAVGKHMDSFVPQGDATKIANRLYIKCGKTTGGSNYIVTLNDATSQGIYGIRSKVLTAPSVLDIADATQWGTEKLTQYAYPTVRSTIKNVDITLLKERISADGKARILLTEVPA